MKSKYFILLLLSGILLQGCSLFSKSTAAAPKESPASIKKLTAKTAKHEGLFNIYQDTTNGKVFLEIKKNQIGREFLHFSFIEDGVLDAGFFRGSYRGSRIFKINKYFNRIEFRLENTSYYFDENNALSKASGANINSPVIFSKEIKGNDGDSLYLIEADDLFIKEVFQQIKPHINPKLKDKVFTMGNYDAGRSKIIDIRNYPENTDVISEYYYVDPYPGKRGSSAVTDSRIVSVKLQHSLIRLPENGFKPRYDDPRIGYFTTQVNDMTTTEIINYRDPIHRWNLEKKNPGEALSEPVKPITYWIENTTPEEFRETIKKGVLRWNEVFEKAGFKNAIVVKIQPDTATWEAGDLRYNVLRWTSSPKPPFGGYGPSFVNPRTGEILGADIMLEYAAVIGRLRKKEVFESAALNFFTDSLNDPHACQLGEYMTYSTFLAKTLIEAGSLAEISEEDFVKETLYRLVLHEVGHTLGLTHNFQASYLHSVDEVHNENLTNKEGLTGSVMEYPAINFAPKGKKQGQFYDSKPGPYDFWVIEFGYSAALEDEEKEEKRLDNILSRSTEPELAYGNDADDMRSPGKGIDPRKMIFDLSNDPIGYSIERIGLVNETYPKIIGKFTEEGESYQKVLFSYYVLSGEQATALNIITRHIGGVYVDRSMAGQTTVEPLTPVAYKDQKRAMKALENYAFAPGAFQHSDELYRHLLAQRRGFSHFNNSNDPKIHSRILNIQKNLLAQLLHKNVLERITDSRLYGNEYDLGEFMTDLTDAIFLADLKSAVNTTRQNLQVEYVKNLIQIINPTAGYDNVSMSMAVHELNRIEAMNKKGYSPDTLTRAHREHIIFLIEKALEKN